MDNKPEINLNSGESVEVNADLKFDNVTFYYPSKPE